MKKMLIALTFAAVAVNVTRTASAATPPLIEAYPPNNAGFTTAELVGELADDYDAPASVWFCWGTEDYGKNLALWGGRVIALGTQPVGPVSTPLAGLAEDTPYVYRLYAENSYGGSWSEPVRFTTAFTSPTVNTDGLVLWLRADAGVSHSNGQIYAWADQATAMGGASKAVASGNACPAYEPDAIGGRAAIRFDGVDDFLTVAYHSALGLGTGAGKGWTVLTVYRREKSGTSAQNIVSKGTSASAGTDWRVFIENNRVCWGTGAASDPNAWFNITEPPANQTHILAATLTQTGAAEGTKVLYADGVAHVSGTYAVKAAADTQPCVIGGFASGSLNLGGLIAEVMVFNKTLDDETLNDVGWYLQSKYGLNGLYAPGSPLIEARPPSNAGFTTAELVGDIVFDYGLPTSVWFCWGTEDYGENLALWGGRVVALGTQPLGPVSTPLMGLTEDTTYVYRMYAENSSGGSWSKPVRFTTAFTPEFVKTDGLVLWLRADAGVSHSNGQVYAWADQAIAMGGASKAVASGNACPAYEPDSIGGRAAIRFDGVDDFLTVPYHSALGLGTGAGKGWTVLTVYRREKSGTSAQNIVSKGTSGSAGTDWRVFIENNLVCWGTGAASDPNAWFNITEPPANQPHVLVATLTQTGAAAGTKVLYADGVAYPSGTYAAKAAADTQPCVIGGFASGSLNLGGLIAEVMVFNKTLDDKTLNNAGWYLQAKYGIAGFFKPPPPRGTVLIVK